MLVIERRITVGARRFTTRVCNNRKFDLGSDWLRWPEGLTSTNAGPRSRCRDQGERGSAKHAPAQNWESVSQVLHRIRTAARRGTKEKFTSLLHHINPAMLRTACYTIKRDAVRR
jgi:hypothetical protein